MSAERYQVHNKMYARMPPGCMMFANTAKMMAKVEARRALAAQ
jgi:hypothetical protein